MHQVTKYSNYSKDFEKFYTGSGINTWRFGNTTVSGTVGVGNLSVEHRAFAVETYFKNNDPVVLTQRICLRHFNIHRNDSVPSRNTLLLWARNFRETASAAKRKPPGREPAIRTPENIKRVRPGFCQKSSTISKLKCHCIKNVWSYGAPNIAWGLKFLSSQSGYGSSNKWSRHCKSESCEFLLNALDNDDFKHVLVTD